MEKNQFNALTAMQRLHFQQAANLQYAILYVQIAIAVLGAAVVFVTGQMIDYSASILGASLVISWLILFINCRKKRDLAERLRRATLVSGGLGIVLSREEFCDLMLASGATESQIHGYHDPTYYAAQGLPPGAEKLAGMLCESSFFSAYLLARSAWIYASVCFVTFVVCVGTILVALTVLDRGALVISVRFVCCFATLLVSTDLLGASIAYASAAETVRNVIQRLRLAKANGYPQHDLLMILGDYNSAVEGAPLFPPGVYAHYADWLNDTWKRSDSYEPACK